MANQLNVPYKWLHELPERTRNELYRNFAEIERLASITSSPSPYAAIVDSTFTSNDTSSSPMKFTTIGAALAATNGAIAVVNRSGGYSDSSAITLASTPYGGTTRLIGISPNGSSPPYTNKINWTLSGAALVTGPNIFLENLYVISSRTPMFSMTQGIMALNCEFQNSVGGVCRLNGGAGNVFLEGCGMLGVDPGTSVELTMLGGSYAGRNAATYTSANGSMYLVGVNIDPNAATITLTGATNIEFVGCYMGGESAAGASVTSGGTINVSGATSVVWEFECRGISFVSTITDPTRLTMRVNGTAARQTITWSTKPQQVHASGTYQTLDVKGPAAIDVGIVATLGSALILRGDGIVGTATAQTESNGNTFIQFIACSDSNIQASAGAAAGITTAKYYSFDASSNRNILDITGESLAAFGTASTDAGANNIVRTTAGGGVAFGAVGGQIDIGDAAANGTATTSSRSDHQHAFPAPAANYVVDESKFTGAAKADGTATTPARSDHTHGTPNPTDQAADASADLTLTNTFTDITGATVTFTPSHATTRCWIVVTVDFDAGTSTDLMHGVLVVDGVADAKEVVAQGTGTQSRWTVSRMYFRSLTAASHTLKIQAKQDGATGGTARSANTRIEVIEFD